MVEKKVDNLQSIESLNTPKSFDSYDEQPDDDIRSVYLLFYFYF